MSQWRPPEDGSPDVVTPTRTINTGAGLQGGGDLSANRTLSIATGGVTDAMLANKYDQLTAHEQVASSAALSLSVRTSRLDASGASIVPTLADSTRVGQRKSLVMYTAPAGNHADVTPATFGDGLTKIRFTAQWQSAELEWQAGGWRIVSLVGAVAS